MEKSFERQVGEALREFEASGTIDELVEFVSERVIIPPDIQSTAVNRVLKSVVRRQIKQRRDADGLSEFQSIERIDADGEPVRVYKQLRLFDKGEYQKKIDYHSGIVAYHARVTNSLAVRCNKVHGTKRQLPFPGFGLLADDKEAEAS